MEFMCSAAEAEVGLVCVGLSWRRVAVAGSVAGSVLGSMM